MMIGYQRSDFQVFVANSTQNEIVGLVNSKYHQERIIFLEPLELFVETPLAFSKIMSVTSSKRSILDMYPKFEIFSASIAGIVGTLVGLAFMASVGVDLNVPSLADLP